MDGYIAIADEGIEIRWDTESKLAWQRVLNAVRRLPDAHFYRQPDGHWRLPSTRLHAVRAIDLADEFEIAYDQGLHALASHKGFHDDPVDHVEGLREYQDVAVTFIRGTEGRAIIGDDVGLGKTIEALAYCWTADIVHGTKRGLVVAPANVIYKWSEEILDPDQRFPWSGQWTVVVVPTSTSELPQTDWMIMSYEILRRISPKLLGSGLNLTCLILDESHYIKNYKAARTKTIQLVSENIPHILALSGTPMPNGRPIELWTTLNLLAPELFPSLWGKQGYGERYCGGKTWEGTFTGATNLPELNMRLEDVMISRDKSDELIGMPSLTRTFLPVSINMGPYKKVASNVQKAILNLSPNSKGYWVNVLDKMNLLRKAAGVGKLDATASWAINFLERTPNEEKLVIFAHHKDVVAGLMDRCKRVGFVPLSIVGSTPAKKRNEIRRQFQSDPEPRVLIISLAGGEGIDLFGIGVIRCSNILFAETVWTPAQVRQIEGRLHREGQKLPVNSWIMQGIGTIDDFIVRRQKEKQKNITDATGQKDIAKELIGLWRSESG